MRRRKRYGLAYGLVLLAAVAGFLVVREQARAIEPPQLALPSSVQQVITELDLFSLFARLVPAVTPAPRPTPTTPVRTPQPVVVQGPQATATPASATQASPTVANTSPGADTPVVELPFAPTGPVRHSSDDCAGASIRGVVRDAAGNLLAGVRLWRYDQWGNEEVVESQSGEAERGQYGFSFGDTPNVHYVQVVDAGGAIISPVVQIQHRQEEAADALCHWVDWQQR